MNKVFFYKGVHKVKIVAETPGYLTVEALENFEDFLNGKRVSVKTGKRRIVPSETVHLKKYLPPPIKEHTYELEMEKKVKELVDAQRMKHSKK